jgi:hypothetical protein
MHFAVQLLVFTTEDAEGAETQLATNGTKNVYDARSALQAAQKVSGQGA